MDSLNRAKIQQHFSAAMESYNANALVQAKIVAKLTALLPPQLAVQRCLEIGCGTGGLTAALQQHCQIKQWDMVDLCDCRCYLNAILPEQSFQFYQADAEQFLPPHRYDLIASASTLQWFGDKQAFLHRTAEQLNPNGVLLFSTFGENNLLEIKQLTGIGLDYPSLDQWRQWLAADFDILHLSQERIALEFDSPQAVLRHLKATGVTATTQKIWTKHRLQQFVQDYQTHYRTSANKVRLSYEPIYAVARRKI